MDNGKLNASKDFSHALINYLEKNGLKETALTFQKEAGFVSHVLALYACKFLNFARVSISQRNFPPIIISNGCLL